MILPLWIVPVVIIIIYLFSSIKILREYDRGVIFRLDRILAQPKGPGIFLVFTPLQSSQPYRAVTIAALIESLFSTFDTPGADHATLSAAFRSAQLETAPVRTTVDPRIST